MRFANRSYWALCTLYCVCAIFVVRAADDALPADVQPALRADLNASGLLTWWLVSPTREAAPNEKTPSNAREGEPVFAENAAAGMWSSVLADTYYSDLPGNPHGEKGSFFAAARLHSLLGGKRIFYINTNCAVRVFLDGNLLAAKPQPDGRLVHKVPLILPQGISELLLELVPRGENCVIQCALHDGKGANPPQKPVVGDSIALPTAKGKETDAPAAALRCFGVGAKPPFVSPGGKAAIYAVVQGSVPRGADGIVARLIDKNGEAAGKDMPVSVNQVFQIDYTALAEVNDIYIARLEFRANGKSLGIKSVPLICLEGCTKDAEKLERDWRERSVKSGHSMPNTKLAIEKIKLFVDGIRTGTVDADGEVAKEIGELIENAHRFAELEEQGKDPFEGKSGYMVRGYTSAIDDGVQPYIVSVPAAATAKNADTFPLIVFLHGYDPNMNKHRWWEAKDYAAVCARNGCFLAIPFGRLNTDFQTCGEVDVLDVIKEMKANYRIDPDRVYLCGISMGGMGVYSLAAHYPDQFAAAMVLAGRADSPLQNNTALENFHPFKQWLINADNPISLCENLTNIPLRIYHGQDDAVVPPTQALRMSAALKKAGCDAKLLLVPGGHRSGFDILREDEPVRWLLSNKRNANPATRRIKTYSLHYLPDELSAARSRNPLEPIEVEWKLGIKAEVKVVKESENVFHPVNTDGAKTKELCGPVRQAICTAFTIVYGTKGTPAANEFNKKNAERFADEWFQFTRSKAQIKADTELTPDDKFFRNLFLFGEEQDNEVHATLAKDLPISIKDGNVTIAGKTVPLAGKGIMYIFPSTFSGRKRAVVICAGIPYGEKIGVNHKLDLIPDFLLYDSTFDTDGTSTNRAFCAGFFDNAWKLDEKLTWWFDKK